MTPTHVIVGVPMNCARCEGKGRVPGGYYRDEGEIIRCPDCKGSQLRREAMPLADFIRLVTANAKEPKR